MSNSGNDDKLTPIDDAAEILSDEQLEDVDGGYFKIELENVQKVETVGGAGVSPFAGNTVIASGGKDALNYQDGNDLILRKRPGR